MRTIIIDRGVWQKVVMARLEAASSESHAEMLHAFATAHALNKTWEMVSTELDRSRRVWIDIEESRRMESDKERLRRTETDPEDARGYAPFFSDRARA